MTMKVYLTKLTCLSVLLCIATSTWSDPEPLPNTSTNKQVWNLKNADIRAIIQTVSLMTGKNFIIDPRVQGKVTFISHNPMSSDELYRAFLSMLQILNFSAVQTGDIIKIVPSVDANSINTTLASRTQPGNGDELVVRIIPIINVSAVQLLPALRPLMPEWSTITAYTPSNSLILASTAANIDRLHAMITQMDSANTNETAMVTLQHANAVNIVNTLNNLENSDRSLGKVDNFSVAADKTSNSILISGNIQNIALLQTLIHQLDEQTSLNSSISAQVVYLNYLSAKKLAPVLTKLLTQSNNTNGMNLSSSNDPLENISIQAEPDNDNALLINAPRHVMSEIIRIIHSLDTKPQQVLVEAIIVKVAESMVNQLGVVWGSVNNEGQSTVTTGGNVTKTDNTLAMKMTGGIGFIAGGNLQALVSALSAHGATNILSTPSIVVLNGQKATISDGQNVGLINREYDNSNATSLNGNQDLGVPFNTLERTDVTLSLTVVPQISPNNMLRLLINQKDDSLDTTSNVVATDGNPVIDTSKISTNVLVRSGDILVLGGLLDNESQKKESKVPILGNIPLIGHFFTYDNHNMQKAYLMVFLKPVILNNDVISQDQTMERYHYVREQEIKNRDGIPLTSADTPVLPNTTHNPPPKALPWPETTLQKRND